MALQGEPGYAGAVGFFYLWLVGGRPAGAMGGVELDHGLQYQYL
jgi:hypothetical protein